MARQKRQGAKNGKDTSRRVSLDDALATTHQHAVPVLPALDPPHDPFADARPTRKTASHARTTLVPRAAMPPQGDMSEMPTARRSAGPRATGSPVARSADVAEAPTARTTAYRPLSNRGSSGEYVNGTGQPGVAPERGAWDVEAANDAADALMPGQPTLGLPTVPSDRLPAVRPTGGPRQVAVRSQEQPQAILIRGSAKPTRIYNTIVPRRSGPRSFAAQFVVSMVSVMVIFTALTVASPLGKSAPFTNTFQAYANGAPWVPTPTPTPTPTPKPQAYVPGYSNNPGTQTIINEIVAVFGSYSTGALNVARCESGYNPNAWNPYAIAGSHAEGVFQILYPSTWNGTSYASYSPYNYDANIKAAYQIFSRDGYSWVEWACKP